MRKKLMYGLLATGLTGALSAVAADHSWPQWQGVNRDGRSAETGLLEKWPADGPKSVWLFENAGNGYGGPAVVDDEMYILGTRDGQEQLFEIDLKTGTETWVSSLGGVLSNAWGDGPRSTPTVVGGFVYALSGTGRLVCVARSDGARKWSVSMEDLGGETPNWGYTESVLVDAQKVICTPGGSKGTVAALDAASGKVLWQTSELTEDAHYASAVAATINGVPQYVQRTAKVVFGVRASDGKVLWQTDFPGRTAVIPTPVVKDNHVYVTAGYGAGCKMVTIGSDWSVDEVYSNKTMKNHHGGVVLVDGRIYGYSDGGGWVCQDFMTGREIWSEKGGLRKGAVSYADGRLYCLEEDTGTVALLNATPDGYDEICRFELSPQSSIRSNRGKVWTHPVIADGRLYLRDQNYIYCFDISS